MVPFSHLTHLLFSVNIGFSLLHIHDFLVSFHTLSSSHVTHILSFTNHIVLQLIHVLFIVKYCLSFGQTQLMLSSFNMNPSGHAIHINFV
jgi:hypothetical protein